jgi:hypothetical protein
MTRHGMSEAELRVLDGKVHEALYPGVTLAVRGRGDIPTHWVDVGRMVEIQHYSTDIGAWEPVYALHPEWRWLQSEVTGDGYVAVVTRLQDHARADESQFFVDNSEYPTSGLDRLARGRARCVIAWAAGRGEG